MLLLLLSTVTVSFYLKSTFLFFQLINFHVLDVSTSFVRPFFASSRGELRQDAPAAPPSPPSPVTPSFPDSPLVSPTSVPPSNSEAGMLAYLFIYLFIFIILYMFSSFLFFLFL
jgi:hypothetical protein